MFSSVVVDVVCPQEFDSLRSAAVQAVVIRHPALTVPYLTSSLLGQELPLGLKLVVVDWLMAAARELSDIPELQQHPSAITDGTTNSSTTASATVDSMAAGAVGASVTFVPKVRIKRPTVLANAKKRTRYFRNDFGPLAVMFIHPLVSLLGRAWVNALHEPLLPRAGDQFNVIQEMFEPAVSGSSAGIQTTTVVQKDLSLKHLDGVDALLPSQCLVALGLFARCCVNTVGQRYAICALPLRSSTYCRIVMGFF